MAALTQTLGMLISQPMAKDVLKTVAESKSMLFRDLVDRTKSFSAQATDESVREVLNHLQSHQLIGIERAGFDDFNIVYVTADGLEATRKLGR